MIQLFLSIGIIVAIAKSLDRWRVRHMRVDQAQRKGLPASSTPHMRNGYQSPKSWGRHGRRKTIHAKFNTQIDGFFLQSCHRHYQRLDLK